MSAGKASAVLLLRTHLDACRAAMAKLLSRSVPYKPDPQSEALAEDASRDDARRSHDIVECEREIDREVGAQRALIRFIESFGK